MHACVYVCACMRACMCVHACMYVCMCACMCVHVLVCCPVLQTFSNIFSLLQSVKARDEGKGEQPAPKQEAQVTRNPQPPTGYNRYGQERFRGQEGGFKGYSQSLQCNVPCPGRHWTLQD